MDLNLKEWWAILQSLLSWKAFKGPYLKKYTERIKTDLNVNHVVLFPSGRTGFHYLIDSLFQAGDEIICSIYTFPFFIRLLHEKG